MIPSDIAPVRLATDEPYSFSIIFPSQLFITGVNRKYVVCADTGLRTTRMRLETLEKSKTSAMDVNRWYVRE